MDTGNPRSDPDAAASGETPGRREVSASGPQGTRGESPLSGLLDDILEATGARGRASGSSSPFERFLTESRPQEALALLVGMVRRPLRSRRDLIHMLERLIAGI